MSAGDELGELGSTLGVALGATLDRYWVELESSSRAATSPDQALPDQYQATYRCETRARAGDGWVSH
jgi:hypothetical protein